MRPLDYDPPQFPKLGPEDEMKTAMLWIGRLSGIAGALLCAVSLGVRFGDLYYLGGIPVGTLFNAGVGVMVFACLAYLSVLAESSAP
jgi:hypothetical protein